jgi:hypothetical protein
VICQRGIFDLCLSVTARTSIVELAPGELSATRKLARKRGSRRWECERLSIARHFLEADIWTGVGMSVSQDASLKVPIS